MSGSDNLKQVHICDKLICTLVEIWKQHCGLHTYCVTHYFKDHWLLSPNDLHCILGLPWWPPPFFIFLNFNWKCLSFHHHDYRSNTCIIVEISLSPKDSSCRAFHQKTPNPYLYNLSLKTLPVLPPTPPPHTHTHTYKGQTILRAPFCTRPLPNECLWRVPKIGESWGMANTFL